MASAITLCKKILNVKNAAVTDTKFFEDQDGVNHVRISIRPNKRHENDCPYCHKACPSYDHQIDHPRTWRGLD